MDAPKAPAMTVFSTTATLPREKKAPKLSEVQVFSEEGAALPETHYFAELTDKGELTLTLADEMPAGIYLVYTGKRKSLAKIRKG